MKLLPACRLSDVLIEVKKGMSELINDKICPFCKRDNRCGVKDASACWCQKVEVPKGLVDLLAVELKEKSCICSVCIEAYHSSAQLFQKKYS